MSTTATQKKFARGAMLISVIIGIIGLMYFTTRGEVVTGLVVGTLFGVGGYWEYKRRIRDLEQADMGGAERDPFEERERRR
ncbi:DUF441 domain-containing protein [Natronolimnobius sp. AArcel1]|uniref:DUF441 domain-containing protein n=1 Tax=Natronolimnobius sp. AArcel1 TaxID=1679093 RepID=UPI0013EDDCA2|nr:DUF441 domain-containing protein [Natronolimnobius sp. AArcel1]NGM69810.1 DUF441 domain-containing protein [Natronolimnobius sp. AArcel1]